METTSTVDNIFHSLRFVWQLSGQLSVTNCEFCQFTAKLRNEWHFTTMSTSALMTWYLGSGAIHILLYASFSNTCIVTDVYCWRCRMSGCREALFESYINMLHQHCDEAPGTYSVLQEVLLRSIKEFPNNMYLLTTAAKLQVSTGLFFTQKNLISLTLWKAIIIIIIIYYCKSSFLLVITHEIFTLPFIVFTQYCHNFTKFFSITWCLSFPYAFTLVGLSVLHSSCKVNVGFNQHHFVWMSSIFPKHVPFYHTFSCLTYCLGIVTVLCMTRRHSADLVFC